MKSLYGIICGVLLTTLFSSFASANAYLQSTHEVDINSSELIALASSLDNDPVKIYNWIYNNIEYDDYKGARKNALSTYWSGAGNSWDQSSLLINLYRIIGIETRYAFPNASLVTTAQRAEYQTELTTGQSDGTIPASRTLDEHIQFKVTDSDTVYVEANISLNQARGFGGTEKIWIQLAPWKKAHTNLQILTNYFDNGGKFIYEDQMTFTIDDFLTKLNPKTAWESYKEELTGVLNDNGSSLKKGQVNYILLKRTGSVLPLSLPLSITTVPTNLLSASAAVPNNQKLKVTVFLKESNTNRELLRHDVYLTQVSTSRLVVDFTASSSYNGIISDASNLAATPVLKLDEAVIATGLATNTNNRYMYSYQVEGEPKTDRLTRDVGMLEVLTYDHLNMSNEYIAKLKEELNSIPFSHLSDWRTRGEYLSRYLAILSGQYLMRYKQAQTEADTLLNMKTTMPRKGVFSINMYCDLLAEHLNYEENNADENQQQKYLIHPPINIDAQLKGGYTYNIVNGRSIPFNSLINQSVAVATSHQEGLIFEDWQSTSSGSTIHALMVASEDPTNSIVKTINNGVTLYTTAQTVSYEGLNIDAEMSFSANSMGFLYNGNNGGSTTLSIYGANGFYSSETFSSGNWAGITSWISWASSTAQRQASESSPYIPPEFSFSPPASYGASRYSDGDPVDVYSGEFYQEELPDIYFKYHADLDFSVTRTYRSKSSFDGPFGYGWTWNHMERLIVAEGDGSIIYFSNDGKGTKITVNGDNDYEYAPGITFTLSKSENQYTIREKNGFQIIFDSNGFLIEKKDLHNNSLAYTYDSNYRIEKILDNKGKYFILNYGGNNKVSSVVSSDNQTVYYNYYNDGDANGAANDLKGFTNLESNETHYEYIVDSDDGINDHNLKKYTLPESEQDYLEIHYYKNDQVSHHVNSYGERFDFQYSIKNQYTETWNEEGYYRKVFFNDSGDVTRIDTKDRSLETKTYDDDHNVLSETDANGNTTEYTYDDDRNVLTMTDALGNVTTYTYTDNDYQNNPMVQRLVETMTYANGDQETYSYYNTGLLKEKIEINGNSLSYTYDSKGNMLTDKANNIAAADYRYNVYTYDTSGINLLMAMRDGKTTTYTYDVYGNVLSEVDALGYETQFQYDNFNQKTQEINAKGEVTNYTYNKNRQLLTTTLPNLAVTENVYYPARDIVTKGLLKETIDPYGNREQYFYDAVGNMIKSIDRNNNVSTFKYNELNKVIEQTNARGHTISYKYDGLGNVLEEKVDVLNQYDTMTTLLRYQYDKLSRVTQKSFYNSKYSNNNNYTDYTYDSVGNLVDEKTYIYKEALGFYDFMLHNSYEYEFNNQIKVTKRSTYRNDSNQLSYFQTTEESYAYDKLNRRTSYTNPTGATTIYSYVDGTANVQEETVSFDDVTISNTYTYTLLNQLATQTDSNGNVTATHYDELGRKISVTNADNQVTSFEYNNLGKLTKTTTPLGYSDSYQYDLMGRQTSFTNKNGHTAYQRYDANSNITSITDTNGFTTHLYYDSGNQKIAEIDDNGREHHYSYDVLGNLLSETSSDGTTTYYQYDGASNRIAERIELDSGKVVSSSRTYDGLKRLTHLIDANGNETTFTYGDFTHPYQVTDAKGNITTFLYTKLGKLNVKVKPNGTRNVQIYDKIGRQTHEINDYDDTANRSYTQYNYDAVGNIVKEYNQYGAGRYIITEREYTVLNQLSKTTIDNTVNSRSYDADGRLLARVDANNNTTSYTYDGLGNTLIVVDGRGNTDTYTYDKRSNQVSYASSEGVSSHQEYDDYDKVIKVTQDNRSKTNEYDVLNRLVLETDYNGNRTSYTYDQLGNRVSQTIAQGTAQAATTTFVYDKNSNLIEVQTPTANQPVVYAYNELNQRITETTAENRVSQYTYDNNGNMASHIQADGTLIEYTYDDQDRQIAVTVDGVEEQRFTYDNLSRLLSSTDHNGGLQSNTTEYSYNQLSQVLRETQNGKTVSISYDVAQNDIAIKYPSGYEIKKTYDETHNLSSLAYDTYDIASYEYNRDNQSTSTALFNGMDIQYDYDHSFRETSRDYGNLFSQKTTYDKNSNILQEKITLNNQQLIKIYAYDVHNRLTDDKHNDHYFIYDLNGNITGTNQNGFIETRQLDSDDQYIGLFGDDPNTISYDLNGNITQYQGKVFEYDFANRLTQVSENAQVVANYTYDAEDRRVSKTVDGVRTTYLYNKNQVVQEFIDTETKPQISYVYSSAIDDPVAFIKDELRYYYIKDRVGSVRAITNEQGIIVERYDYNSLGIMTIRDAAKNIITESAFGNEYTYTGRRYDSETGLYYYRNRMYSAELGRFMSEDPLGYVDGYNLYAYAHNNPLKYIDPLGTTARSPVRVNSGITVAPNNIYTHQRDSAAASYPSGYQPRDTTNHTTFSGSDTGGYHTSYIGGSSGGAPASTPAGSSGGAGGGNSGSGGTGSGSTGSGSGTIASGSSTFGANRGYTDAATGIYFPPLTNDGSIPSFNDGDFTSSSVRGGIDWRDLGREGLRTLEAASGINPLSAGAFQLAVRTPQFLARVGSYLGSVSRYYSNAATRVYSRFVPKGGVLDGANFAQKTFGKNFSAAGKFAGQSVGDVAGALRSGRLKPSDVPIDYITRNGNTLILNTRSSQALTQAGIPRSQWNAINRTGNAAFEARLTGQLARNKLTEAGTSAVRQSGGQ